MKLCVERHILFDAEWNALELEDVTQLWCICTKELITGETRDYYGDRIAEGLGYLRTGTRLLGHNIIGSDLAVFKKLYNWEAEKNQIILDTLLLSRLSYPDRKLPFGVRGNVGAHSIASWAARLGGEQKVVHEDWSQFSEAMLNRCRTDVTINEAVYHALVREMNE